MKRIYTLSTIMLISLAFACGSATEKKENKENSLEKLEVFWGGFHFEKKWKFCFFLGIWEF